MGKKSGFGKTLRAIDQIQRGSQQAAAARARANAAAASASTAAERAAAAAEARNQREAERSALAADKEQKRLYLGSRAAEVEQLNEQPNAYATYLESGILAATLHVDDYVDFEKLKRPAELPEFHPGTLAVCEPLPQLAQFVPPELSWSEKLVPGAGAKYVVKVKEGGAAYENALREHAARDADRQRQLAEARDAYDQHVTRARAEATAQHAEIDKLHHAFDEGQPEAVVHYFSLVLERSVYPETFTKHHKMAFVPESRQLVIEYELPPLSAIPKVKAWKYVKTQDRVDEVARPASQIKPLYSRVLAQVALRTLHEIFEADRGAKLESLVFNGYVDTIDRATGKPVSPCLLTVRATRDAFLALDLTHVEPAACLRGLSAAVSRDPAELAPVRPVVAFNMVDSRFVEETDVLSALDQRPNLMELSPSEFEHLITNLFAKMGLDTKLTQASRDGGVDCVAFDPRPVLGGKVVIQAKRYKNTVGVSAVRDLYGTMLNEGASKGILVATSGYGPTAFEFAKDKPMELLAGGELLYLLKEHADMDAKIVVPENWVDPPPES